MDEFVLICIACVKYRKNYKYKITSEENKRVSPRPERRWGFFPHLWYITPFAGNRLNTIPKQQNLAKILLLITIGFGENPIAALQFHCHPDQTERSQAASLLQPGLRTDDTKHNIRLRQVKRYRFVSPWQ
jgi:hypothetical protein